MTAIALAVVIVAVVGLAVGAVRGWRTVDAANRPASMRRTELDDAYYHCLNVQAHSLISGHQPVLLTDPNFANYFTLQRAVGSWITFANRSAPPKSTVILSLIDRKGPGSCLGNVVIERQRQPDGRTRLRVGSGASLPGAGPPPLVPPEGALGSGPPKVHTQ